MQKLQIGGALACEVIATEGNRIQLECNEAPPGFWINLRSSDRKSCVVGDSGDFWITHIDEQGGTIRVASSDHGRLPISNTMRPRYVKALRAGLRLLEQPSSMEPSEADDLSELGGMYSRALKRDQTDGYTVYGVLERQDDRVLRILSEAIKEAGKLLRTGAREGLAQLSQDFPSQLREDWVRYLQAVEATAQQLENARRRAAQPRISERSEPKVVISTYTSAKLDTANLAHRITVGYLISELRARGFTPKETDFVDVFCATSSGPAIFEIKSLTGENEEAQTRHAYAQVFHYRHKAARQDPALAESSLWVLFSEEPQRTDLTEWLEADDVRVVWMSEGEMRGKVLPWDRRRGKA